MLAQSDLWSDCVKAKSVHRGRENDWIELLVEVVALELLGVSVSEPESCVIEM